VAVEEKPAHPKSPYAVTGIYLYDRHIFEAVKAIRPGRRGELEISDAHQYLLERGYRVGYSEITGWWKDTGKPEDLLEANRLVLDRILEEDGGRIAGSVDAASDVAGKVLVQKGAKVVRSTIRGPAIIGVEATIQDAYIGPFTAIGEGCEIRNSEVEYSIILPRSRLLHVDVRIERSLVGREVTILRGESRPRTHKFIVGDQSVIELP
jgi:glucose-1-phosphate thymidylyltransferase